MKKIIFLILIIGFTFWSCKKKTSDVSTVVKVTHPVITLNGDAFITSPVSSDVYVDAGASGTNDLSGQTSALSPIINDVDLSQEGFYTVVYRMKNDNGFTTTVTRFVLVTSVSATDDWSGLWQRNADPDRPANVEKIGTGLYKIDNVGGFILCSCPDDQGPPIAAYLGLVNDSTVKIPEQTTDDGSVVAGIGFFAIDSTSTPFDTLMQWKMTKGPFLQNNRTFYKAH